MFSVKGNIVRATLEYSPSTKAVAGQIFKWFRHCVSPIDFSHRIAYYFGGGMIMIEMVCRKCGAKQEHKVEEFEKVFAENTN